MTTITDLKVTEKEWQGKKTTSTTITLSDGTSGYLDDKGSDKGLKVGDSVETTVVIPEGKTYKKITARKATATAPQQSSPTPPSTPPSSNKASSTVIPAKTIEEQKVQAAVSATEFVTSMFNAERIDWPKFKEHQRECVQLLWDEIDEIYGKK